MAEPIERWLPVVDWEGLYDVSDLGRVRSLTRVVITNNGPRVYQGRTLKQTIGSHGYPAVGLSRGGKGRNWPVHELVAPAFLGPCPDGQEVRHGPNGKLDNRATELCYGTRKENFADRVRDGGTNRGERHYRAKLTREAVKDIRIRFAAGENQRVLAREYGVTSKNVSMITTRKTWAWLS